MTGAAVCDTSVIRDVPYMGVIYVVAEAVKLGFYNGHPDWANLGQGQPEVGEMEGAPSRISTVALDAGDHAYGPLEGTTELRQAIADYYNRLYRQGLKPYGPQHVAVASGGRLVLSRVFAALGAIRLGYATPDYTAYEDLIDYHLHRVTPVRLAASQALGHGWGEGELEAHIKNHKLKALLLSNPCNPTGNVIQGSALESLMRVNKETGCTLVLDEFYSHFIFDGDKPGKGPVSSAKYVADPDTDGVIIIDGLTKNHRYPGWRVGWIVGPPAIVEAVARTGSAIDGGPSRVAQRAALEALEPARADQETAAVRAEFSKKRNVMLARLERMGITLVARPDSTFYCWASLEKLPAPFNNAKHFFREALSHKVMTVPGEFFDVNPGKAVNKSRATEDYTSLMRFSFGPPMDNMVRGLDRLEEMLQAAPKRPVSDVDAPPAKVARVEA